jgi:NTE family protein
VPAAAVPLPDLRDRRVGLALGAGGTVGIAWLVGALAALREASGWDPAEAEVVAGTSAGSVVAAVLAAGLDPASLLPLAEDRALLASAIADASPASEAGGRRVPAWPGSVALGLTGLLAGDHHRRLGSLLGFLPRGLRSTADIRGLTHAAVRGGWPAHVRLLVHACCYRSGRRVTFGDDGAPPAPLADAVAASCAVPAYYEPVRIGGRHYVDGGLWSFTNADALAGRGLDAVVVLSPASARERGPVLDALVCGPLRRSVGGRLRREASALRAEGTEVVTLEPSGRDLAAMGLNPMGISRSRRIVETARESAVAHLRAGGRRIPSEEVAHQGLRNRPGAPIRLP